MSTTIYVCSNAETLHDTLCVHDEIMHAIADEVAATWHKAVADACDRDGASVEYDQSFEAWHGGKFDNPGGAVVYYRIDALACRASAKDAAALVDKISEEACDAADEKRRQLIADEITFLKNDDDSNSDAIAQLQTALDC